MGSVWAQVDRLAKVWQLERERARAGLKEHGWRLRRYRGGKRWAMEHGWGDKRVTMYPAEDTLQALLDLAQANSRPRSPYMTRQRKEAEKAAQAAAAAAKSTEAA